MRPFLKRIFCATVYMDIFIKKYRVAAVTLALFYSGHLNFANFFPPQSVYF